MPTKRWWSFKRLGTISHHLTVFTYKWLRPIHIVVVAANLPPRVRLTRGGKQLTLLKVCKQCDDGTSDLQVIQCNASNVHGYAFGDGYVNVLSKRRLLNILFVNVGTWNDDWLTLMELFQTPPVMKILNGVFDDCIFELWEAQQIPAKKIFRI